MWAKWARRPSSARIVSSVVAQFPGIPRLLAWTCTGWGSPRASTASARPTRIARGVTPNGATPSSRPVTLPLPPFQASTPPGLTTLTAYPLAAPRSHATKCRAFSVSPAPRHRRMNSLFPMSTKKPLSITGVSWSSS